MVVRLDIVVFGLWTMESALHVVSIVIEHEDVREQPQSERRPDLRHILWVLLSHDVGEVPCTYQL